MLAFREQKLEVLKLQAVIAAKQQEEEERELRAAEEREQKRRAQQHKQVSLPWMQCVMICGKCLIVPVSFLSSRLQKGGGVEFCIGLNI